MRAHVIENGKVVNTIEVESLDFMPGLIEATEGGKGWGYENGNLTPPTIDLAEEKTKKQAALSKYVRLYFDGAMKDYSGWEAISWPILIQEAAQFQIDGTVGEYMAAETGLKYPTAADLAFVLLQRAAVMKAFRAGMVLARQQKEIEINAAQTIQDLEKIDITAGWPE